MSFLTSRKRWRKKILQDLQAYTAPAQMMSWLNISDPTIYRKGNQKPVSWIHRRPTGSHNSPPHTVPNPNAECVTNRATMEENNSGEEAPAAINVAPAMSWSVEATKIRSFKWTTPESRILGSLTCNIIGNIVVVGNDVECWDKPIQSHKENQNVRSVASSVLDRQHGKFKLLIFTSLL